MKKIIQSLAFASIVMLIQACGEKKQTITQAASDDTIPVKVVALSKTKTQSVIQASGQLTTDDETYLSFKTGGVIHSINVKEGDAIHKGQLLASLDLTEINAQVAQARLGFEKAQRDNQRVTRLYKDSVATLEQFQNSKTGLEVAQKQMEAAEFNKSFSEIRALKDGFVLRKIVSEGQVVSPGSSVLLTNGANKGNWIVKCGVSDRDWSAISLKDAAKISIDAFPEEEYTAAVTGKSEGSDPLSGSFTIELSVNGKLAHPSASGMFVKAGITPSHSVEAWTIPFDAILDGDGPHGYVFVTEDGRTAKKVAITIGAINKKYVEVTAGLENAQSLIVSGSAYLTDNSPIRIINQN